MTEFKTVEPCYTGGGIYLYAGQTKDGRYFVGGTDVASVEIVDADPLKAFEQYDQGYTDPEWYEAHTIEYLDEQTAYDFLLDMLDWVIANKPKGNYSLGDMDYEKEWVTKFKTGEYFW